MLAASRPDDATGGSVGTLNPRVLVDMGEQQFPVPVGFAARTWCDNGTYLATIRVGVYRIIGTPRTEAR